MLVKATIKALIKKMLGLFTLLITRAMEALKKEPTEKNNG